MLLNQKTILFLFLQYQLKDTPNLRRRINYADDGSRGCGIFVGIDSRRLSHLDFLNWHFELHQKGEKVLFKNTILLKKRNFNTSWCIYSYIITSQREASRSIFQRICRTGIARAPANKTVHRCKIIWCMRFALQVTKAGNFGH